MTISVLLADDQTLVRTGFRLIIEATPGLHVVAEADNGVDALRLARERRPDVCLLDIRMPGLDGLEVARCLMSGAEATPPAVVMVTTFDLDEYVDQALRLGASGFLLKDSGPELLVEAVRAAASGEALVSPSITTRLVRHYLTRHPARGRHRGLELTPREEEVVLAVARGRTNQEIAEEAHLAVSTVKTHLGAIQRKIGARNRVEIARWAFETHRVG